MKRLLLLAIAPVLAALVVAGCGGGSSGSTQPSNTATGSGAAASVSLRKLNVGNALVDSQGRTLYLFEADKGPMSTCNGACASLWPPDMTSGKPKAGPGVDPAYAPDTKPGEDTGQGLNQFGAKWYVLAASGSKIDSD